MTFAKALVHLKVTERSAVCIMGFNCPEWVIADVGAMMIGAVPAGIYQTCSAPEVEYILNHSEAPIVFLENAEHWGKVAEVRGNLPKLKHVVMLPGADAIEDDQVMSWDEFIAKGDEVAEEDALAKMETLSV